ncbi:hypothetical protein ACROYT_G014591 [Oculina patagonica]
MFVKHTSAGEIGTSSASINRTGKTNASKGVESHFNEYSEFHAREVEAHILASFMEMTDMKDINNSPNGLLPDSSVQKETQAKWLLEICEEHVKKFVLNADADLSTLVKQKKELQEPNKLEGSLTIFELHPSLMAKKILDPVFHARAVPPQLDFGRKLQPFRLPCSYVTVRVLAFGIPVSTLIPFEPSLLLFDEDDEVEVEAPNRPELTWLTESSGFKSKLPWSGDKT